MAERVHAARRVSVRARAGRSARLVLLNGFELTHEGESVALPMPAQRLLAFLALQDHPVARSYAAETLWIDSSKGHALGNLRSALWRLRHRGHGLVVVDHASRNLRLAGDVSVDLHDAVAYAHRLLDQDSELIAAELDEGLLMGELLPEWYDDWVLFERERFHELRVRALESLCSRLTVAGRLAQAMEAGLAAVKEEPFRESAHRSLIRVHLAEGNRAEALRRYRLYRKLVHDELGLGPSPQMEELVEALTAQ